MSRRNILVVVLLVALGLLTSYGRQVEAASPRVTQVVYITLSKACGCLLEKCQVGDQAVNLAFTGDRKKLLKRIDYSTDKDAARPYIKKYRLTLPPSLLFLDAEGNLLWRAEGEIDYNAVVAKLQEFGA